jgi:hypothetical protein
MKKIALISLFLIVVIGVCSAALAMELHYNSSDTILGFLGSIRKGNN